MSKDRLTLRVFLSSPGDVNVERKIVSQLLNQIRDDPRVAHHLDLQLVAWDQPDVRTPMLASLTPQEAINRNMPKPSQCQIVVVLFWSRMGTPLPEDYIKPDGERYLSGTEWEYLDARASVNEPPQDLPLIAIYRRTESIEINPDDPSADERMVQYKRVQAFFEQFKGTDGSLIGGYNFYETVEAFSKIIDHDLRLLITDAVKYMSDGQIVLDIKEGAYRSYQAWDHDPYPGLRPYESEEAPIFFGRGREIDALVQLISKRHLVIVTGASGSGKSSLVNAGVLPRLAENAISGKSTASKDWLVCRFRPTEHRTLNPFLPLAEALVTARGDPAALAIALENDPSSYTSIADQRLRELNDQEQIDWHDILIVVDQFEELFTLVPDVRAKAFLQLLRSAAHHQRSHIVLSVRNDVQPKGLCAEAWIDLISQSSSSHYTVIPPSLGTYHAIITEPARMAGVRIEDDLVSKIIDDIGEVSDALPLLAFSLANLYTNRTIDNRLTLATYQSFGGVWGAIGQYANQTITQIPNAKTLLKRLLMELVNVQNSEAVATRRPAILSKLQDDAEMMELVERLLEARLLVAKRDTDGATIVELVHEALLTHWDLVADTIDSARSALQAKHEVRSAATRWNVANRPIDLLASRSLWLQSQSLDHFALDPLEREFLLLSQLYHLTHDETITGESVVKLYELIPVIIEYGLSKTVVIETISQEPISSRAQEMLVPVLQNLDKSDPTASDVLLRWALHADTEAVRELAALAWYSNQEEQEALAKLQAEPYPEKVAAVLATIKENVGLPWGGITFPQRLRINRHLLADRWGTLWRRTLLLTAIATIGFAGVAAINFVDIYLDNQIYNLAIESFVYVVIWVILIVAPAIAGMTLMGLVSQGLAIIFAGPHEQRFSALGLLIGAGFGTSLTFSLLALLSLKTPLIDVFDDQPQSLLNQLQSLPYSGAGMGMLVVIVTVVLVTFLPYRWPTLWRRSLIVIASVVAVATYSAQFLITSCQTARFNAFINFTLLCSDLRDSELISHLPFVYGIFGFFLALALVLSDIPFSLKRKIETKQVTLLPHHDPATAQSFDLR